MIGPFGTRREAFHAAIEAWEQLGGGTVDVLARDDEQEWCEARVGENGELRVLT
jgi:hypothetical protein